MQKSMKFTEYRSKILVQLICAVCKQLASNTLQCNQCHNILCGQCGGKSYKTCPFCRVVNPKMLENKFVKNLVDRIPIQCPNSCEIPSVPLGEVKFHIMNKCPKQNFNCRLPKCTFFGSNELITQHIFEVHQSEIMQTFTSPQECSFTGTPLPPLPFDDDDKNPIQTKKNQIGNTSRLGRNGQYYCGNLIGYNCECCDGHCGPDSGCACIHCLKLTIAARKLKQGQLVNNEGATCLLVGNRYYCGRKVMGVPRTDGYCGPNNGPNCQSCQKIERNVVHYQSLL